MQPSATGVRRAERPGAEEQPRPCGHHHRARHGEGRLRLDLVRTRADGRLSVEPDRDRADHRPRHPRRAGQDPRPLHEPDRRAGRLRRSRHRGRQRHAEGDRRQPCSWSRCLRRASSSSRRTRPAARSQGFDYGEGGYDPNKCNVGFNEETRQFQIEIKGLTEPKSEEAQRICQQDLNEVIAAFVQDKTAIERGLFDRGACARGADPSSHGQDHQGQVSRN